MIYGGQRTLSPHPRPLQRKTSALDTYYRNGIPAGTLSGLGIAFADLPNGGHNLRLYTYDPVGSQYGPKSCGADGWIYNTGHYDISLGTPCSSPDARGFCDWQSMSSYAASHGETLVLVSRNDLSILCGYRAPVATAQPTVPGATFTQPSIPVSTTPTPRPVTAPGSTSQGIMPVGITTTSTTTTTATGGGGAPGGGGGGGMTPAPDNTLLYLGIAVLVSVMLAK